MEKPDVEKWKKKISQIDIEKDDIKGNKKLLAIPILLLVFAFGFAGYSWLSSADLPDIQNPLGENEPDTDYRMNFSIMVKDISNPLQPKPIKDHIVRVGESCENAETQFQTDENGNAQGTYYWNEGENIVWCIDDYQTKPQDHQYYSFANLPSQQFQQSTVAMEFIRLEVSN